MTDPPSPPPSGCPDLETWCAYVDGSVAAGLRPALAQHLAACDRCFAAVVQVRISLAESGQEAAEVQPQVRRRWILPRVAAAVAAAVALLWLGWWSLSKPMTDEPTPETIAVARQDPRLGFAGRGQDATEPTGAARALVLFSQFRAPQTRPVPPWATGPWAELCGPLSPVLAVDGVVWAERFASRLPASAYVRAASGGTGPWQRYVEEILRQVDARVDFAQFDGDGDGLADFVVLVLPAVPGFLPGGDGRAGLGVDYVTADPGARGAPVQVSGSPTRGALVPEGEGLTAQDLCRSPGGAGR